MGDLLVPCRHGLIRDSLAGVVLPVVSHNGNPWVLLELAGKSGCVAMRDRRLGICGGNVPLVNLLLDLARPEVRDHLARVLGPWRASLDGAVVWWLRRIDVDESAALHPRIVHFLRLLDIARADHLTQPQPGDWLRIYRDDDVWVVEAASGGSTRASHYEGHADITDPAEAARVIWEDICND